MSPEHSGSPRGPIPLHQYGYIPETIFPFYINGTVFKMRRTLLITSLLLMAAIFTMIAPIRSSSAYGTHTRNDDNDMGNATEILVNASASDSLHNQTDYVDWYVLPLEAGDIVTVNLTVPSTGDFSLTVYDPAADYLISSSAEGMGGYREVRFMANVTDGYFLQLFTFWGYGDYTLTVTGEGEYPSDGNDFLYLATEITPPATIEDELLEGIDDDDFFKLMLGENDFVHVTMVFQPALNFDLYLQAENGTVMAGSTDYAHYEELNHTAGQEGYYYIRAAVGWGGGDYIMQVSVTRANLPPEVISRSPAAGIVTVDEGNSAVFEVSASDPETDSLFYSWLLDDEEMKGENEPTLNITTAYAGELSAGEYSVKVIVSDYFASVNESWELVVQDVNPLPEITVKWPPGRSATISENENVNFVLTVSDPDGTEPGLQWFEDGEAVPGATLQSHNFRADYGMAGTHTVKLVVTDATDDALTVAMNWTVVVLNVDRPPMTMVVYPAADTETDEERQVEFTFNVSDPDGDEVSYAWFFDGELLDDESGPRYIYIPDYDSGDDVTHEVKVEASSGGRGINRTWKLIINDVNRWPSLNLTGTIPQSGGSFTSGKKVEFRAQVQDPDGDDLTYSWVMVETGEELSNSSGFSRSFDAGHHTVLLTVKDGKGGEDSVELRFEVQEKTDSPGFELVFLLLAVLILLFHRISVKGK